MTRKRSTRTRKATIAAAAGAAFVAGYRAGGGGGGPRTKGQRVRVYRPKFRDDRPYGQQRLRLS